MFQGNPFEFQGFVVASNSPLFLVVLAVHILSALTCVVSGVLAMFAEKKRGQHSKSGAVYYWFLWVVFITATIITIIRFKEDLPLFILGLVALFSAYIGRKAQKSHRKSRIIVHITGMGISFIFLLTAFYVDNGKFLPVWRNFNYLMYWLLPGAVGIPVILITLFRHPLARNYFKK